MRSTRIVLFNESQQLYDDLSARFFELFSPNDIFEHELVTNIVNARWCIRRLQAAATASLELAIGESRPQYTQKYANLTPMHEHALAYRAIAQSGAAADLIGRHEDRQHRILERSYRLLAKHRGRHGALPSAADLVQAENDLPPDNMASANPLKPEPHTQNETFEPENAPEPANVEPPHADNDIAASFHSSLTLTTATAIKEHTAASKKDRAA
jgi:hypothetical protein